MLAWTPGSPGILQCGPYHCGVGRGLDFWGTHPEVPSQAPHCSVSSCCCILNMGGPGEVMADSDAQALAGTCCFHCFPMEGVAGCENFTVKALSLGNKMTMRRLQQTD